MYLFIYVFLSELVEYFRAQIREDPDVASAVAAIRSLLEFLKRDQSEFSLNMTKAIHRLEETDSSVAVSSGGELFLRFISLTSLEHPDLSQCKNVMIERGELFLKKISLSRGKVLENAAADNKRFTVYVTESQPDSTGLVPIRWPCAPRHTTNHFMWWQKVSSLCGSTL
uniref:Translation initiation factor eIF2B subunit alpha n=1 Tax=Sinocyclocheilus grahami TaxID=75366 RepID=A0A672P5T7_SINGR